MYASELLLTVGLGSVVPGYIEQIGTNIKHDFLSPDQIITGDYEKH